MKKLLVIILSILSLLLVSCSTSTVRSDKDETSKEAQTISTTETTQIETTEAVSETTIEGQLGDYVVNYLKHEIIKDYEGKPALVIYLAFTNNSEDAASYMFSMMPKAFQNGVELESAFVTSEIPEYNNSQKEIKPGVSLDVCSIYKLDDKTSDVEFEISELISFSDDKIVELLKLA